MQTYFNVAQIVLAVALISVILLQVRGGGLGGIFGQPDSVYRKRHCFNLPLPWRFYSLSSR